MTQKMAEFLRWASDERDAFLSKEPARSALRPF